MSVELPVLSGPRLDLPAPEVSAAVETAALRELLRYAPSRKEEAYNLFAERCMDEMKHCLEEHDKEYAKLALEGVATNPIVASI